MARSENHRETPVAVKVQSTRPRPRPAPVAPAPRPTPPSGLTALPEARRRRMLWISVSVCAVLIFGSWGLVLAKHEYTGTPRESSFFQDISQAIRNFHLTTPSVPATNQAVTNLDQQVFPQFHQ